MKEPKKPIILDNCKITNKNEVKCDISKANSEETIQDFKDSFEYIS